MSDVKLSQLSSMDVLEASDLFAVSESLGGGNWASKSISALNLGNSLNSTGTMIIGVAKDGIRNADTIQDAIAIANSYSPSASAPVAIRVLPGYYQENVPLIIPQYVTIYTDGGNISVSVVANNDGPIFITSGNSTLKGFTIIGGNAFSNIAYKSSTSLTSQIEDCVIKNCHTGVLSDGGSIIASHIAGLSTVRKFEKFFSSINEGFINVVSCNLTGTITRPTNGFCSEGVESEMYLFSVATSNCINGMHVDDSGYIDCFSAHLGDCDNGIHIGTDGSCEMKCVGCVTEDNILDLNVESATANVSYSGYLDSSKFSIVDGATVNIVADDHNTNGGLILGKSSLQGKVSIGYPGAIASGADLQLNIGDGSAFVNDNQGNPIVEYWSYDASQPSGSRFTRFINNAGTQLTDSSHAIVVGCKYEFPAIRLDVNVAVNLGSSDIITEYWNGSMWIPIGVAAYKRSTFERRANKIFENVETQFISFSDLLYTNGDWEHDINVLDNIPNWDSGDEYYTIRFRNNGALTSGMVFSNGLVKPESFMVSTSGYKVNFGRYRTTKSLYIDSQTFSEDATNPPTYTDLQMSPNVSYADIPTFAKATPISRVSTAFIVPFDIDTSSPLQIYVDGITTIAAAGDIVTSLCIARIDHKNPPTTVPITDEEFNQVTTTPGTANAFVTVSESIDISAYDADDLLLISFARLASDGSDTYTGDFMVGDITIKHKSVFI